MENISVYIRLKPTKDNPQSSFSFDLKTITNTKTNEVFTFDSVIAPNQTNKDIFENLIKQNLTSLLKGINISIFAYGQTSTGKTYTMKGDSKLNEGLIPLSIREIFNSLNSSESNIIKSLVKVSYAEIYNETVNDLIDKYKLAHKMIIEDVSRFKEEPEALAGLFLRMCNKEQAIIEADTQDNCD